MDFERTRPSDNELTNLRLAPPTSDGRPGSDTSPPFVHGMWRYARAVSELIEHAIDFESAAGRTSSALANAQRDAAALADELGAFACRVPTINEAARLYTRCSLWEASHVDVESGARDIDPAFHRHWRARNLAVIRLRHGALRLERALQQ